MDIGTIRKVKMVLELTHLHVKRFEQSQGLDTVLYKNLPFTLNIMYPVSPNSASAMSVGP